MQKGLHNATSKYQYIGLVIWFGKLQEAFSCKDEMVNIFRVPAKWVETGGGGGGGGH